MLITSKLPYTIIEHTSEDRPVGACINGDNLPVGGREALLTAGSVNAPGPMLEQSKHMLAWGLLELFGIHFTY